MGGGLGRVPAVAAALACVSIVVALTGSAPSQGAVAREPDNVTFVAKRTGPAATRTVAPVSWCGTDEVSQNRTPEMEISAPQQVHVVYAIPSDGVDQFGTSASHIATDAAAMSAWWQGQDATRAPRFDLYAFSGCGSRFGDLDISFIRLPHDSAYYNVDVATRIGRMTFDLGGLAANSSAKTLLFYDGPVFEPTVCGTSFVAPQEGGAFGIAYLWLGAQQCPNDLGQGGFTASVAVHELTHDLGALSRAGAPHECTDPSQRGHVCDAANDILFPFVFTSTRIDTQVLDFGRDDYYAVANPALFDVQDSPWLSHLPELPLTIGQQSSGGATGTVVMSTPTSVSCTSSCSFSVDTGTKVTLQASPSKGARLVAWSGACTGTGACTLTMDGAKTVTAQFGPATFAVSISVSGKGHVTSSPAGISCPSRCSHRFPGGENVRLQTKPRKGFRFAGWSGSCHGTRACTLATSRDRSAHATFKRKRS